MLKRLASGDNGRERLWKISSTGGQAGLRHRLRDVNELRCLRQSIDQPLSNEKGQVQRSKPNREQG
jgi:hypothetical protein